MMRIKKINSHVGKARYLAECSDDPIGFIPRQKDIPSPYVYSQTHVVWRHENGRQIFIVETSHKKYEVFCLNGERVYKDDESAAKQA